MAKKYSFEKEIYSKINVSPEDLHVLDSRLGLTAPESLQNSNVKNKVNTFVNTFSGNINWYLKEIEKENSLKNLYKIITIVLILGLPGLILLFSETISCLQDTKDHKDVEFYSSFAIAILTSIFGFHKILSAWLAKRRLLSIYHEASSGLKSELYAFEDRWNNGDIFKTGGLEVTLEFDNDLEKTISEGRVIADAERKKYYEYTENPEVDLSNIFTSSFTLASNVFKNFQSARYTRKIEELEEERKAMADQEKLISEISHLESHIRELESLEMETANALNIAAVNAAPALQTLLASIQTKKQSLLLELASKKSQL